MVICDPTSYVAGEHVVVTGISSVIDFGAGPKRCIWSSDNALRFDGGDLVQIPHSSSLIPPRITVECWVKFDRLAYGYWEEDPTAVQTLVSKGSMWGYGGSYGLFQWGYQPEEGPVYYGVGFYVGGQTCLSWSSPLETDRWYHVAGTYDGQTMWLYLDGELVSYYSTDYATTNTSAPLFLGCEVSGGYPPFYYLTGELDDVRILDYAMSESSIRQSMHWPYGSWSEDVVGCWRFNEIMTDPYVMDTSGYGNDGTLGPDLTTDYDPIRVLTTAPTRQFGAW